MRITLCCNAKVVKVGTYLRCDNCLQIIADKGFVTYCDCCGKTKEEADHNTCSARYMYPPM